MEKIDPVTNKTNPTFCFSKTMGLTACYSGKQSFLSVSWTVENPAAKGSVQDIVIFYIYLYMRM